MRLISFRHNARDGVGVMIDDRGFVALGPRSPALPQTLRGLLAMGEEGLEAARIAVQGASADFQLTEVELLPVIPDPGAIWCVGVNYQAHRQETGRDPTQQPTMFTRFAVSQVGHLRPIVYPKASDKLDYEGELAVVIGKPGRHIPEEEALSYVAGYSCYNDATLRDWQRHTTQFGPGKNFHRTGGFGPWLLTADELPDPYAETLVTRLNGQERQRSSIDLMIFKIEYVIHYLSTVHPLSPGDVISTGTPGGVGSRRDPPEFMRPGDQLDVTISNLGTLSNPIESEAEV